MRLPVHLLSTLMALPLALGAAGAAAQAQVIELKSPSFTPSPNGPVVGWQPHEHASGNSYHFRIERESPRTPPGSARISRYGPEPFGLLAQDLRIPTEWHGKTARVTAWLKTQGATGAGGAVVLQVQGSGGAILANDQMDDRRVRGDTDWKAYTAVAKIPPGAILLRLGAMLEDDGTLWADDFKLELLD